MSSSAQARDLDLVRRVIETYNTGDVEAILRLYHPDVTIIPTPQFAPPGTAYHGHTGFRTISGEVAARYASIIIRPRELRWVNRKVVALWTSVERLKGMSAPVYREAVHLLTCDDGLVRRVEGFRTEAEALAAAQRQQPVEVAKRYIQACLDGDADAMVAECHPDVQFFPSAAVLSAGTAYTGHDGARSMLADFKRWTYYVALSQDFRESGGRVVIRMVVSRGHTEDDAVVQDVVMLMAFDQDKIRLVESSFTSPDQAASAAPGLTPREREVFQLLALGHNGRDIAQRLFLSPDTVRTHVQNGVSRLGARTRGHAIAIALTRGEIELSEDDYVV